MAGRCFAYRSRASRDSRSFWRTPDSFALSALAFFWPYTWA